MADEVPPPPAVPPQRAVPPTPAADASRSVHDITANEVLSAAPGVARLAASSTLRIVEWGVNTYVHTASDVAKAVMAGDPPAETIQSIVNGWRGMARRALGLPDEANGSGNSEDSQHPLANGATAAELRDRGAQLLARSADVRLNEDTHPAYARILDQLHPDEARILRFLTAEGPQPAVDVRSGRLGIGSELVASGLSMIGLQSGVRWQDHTNAYLNNLFRLGLIWFSREQVAPNEYQVVEVQPDVTDAMRKAGRSAKTVRRSIHLTRFGEDFCDTCLPGEQKALPPGSTVPPGTIP
ncbi:MAG: Abi-alpha family protein [Acidimicrobiales bacterium]